jgi:hypothetical protein
MTLCSESWTVACQNSVNQGKRMIGGEYDERGFMSQEPSFSGRKG